MECWTTTTKQSISKRLRTFWQRQFCEDDFLQKVRSHCLWERDIASERNKRVLNLMIVILICSLREQLLIIIIMICKFLPMELCLCLLSFYTSTVLLKNMHRNSYALNVCVLSKFACRNANFQDDCFRSWEPLKVN